MNPPGAREAIVPDAESLVARALRFGRSAAVGIAATAVDFAVLIAAVRLFGAEPTHAKVGAFLAGLAVQFVGNRHFAFRAGTGDVRRQALLFGAAESVTLALHYVLFRALVRNAHLSIELANALVGVIVYAGFSYPLWKRVFADAPDATPREAVAGRRAT